MTISHDLKSLFMWMQIFKLTSVLYLKTLNACGRGCQGMDPRFACWRTLTSRVDRRIAISRLLHHPKSHRPRRVNTPRSLGFPHSHSPFPSRVARGQRKHGGLPISSNEPEYFLSFSTSERLRELEIAPPDLTHRPDTPRAAPEPEARRRDERAQLARCGDPQ